MRACSGTLSQDKNSYFSSQVEVGVIHKINDRRGISGGTVVDVHLVVFR